MWWGAEKGRKSMDFCGLKMILLKSVNNYALLLTDWKYFRYFLFQWQIFS